MITRTTGSFSERGAEAGAAGILYFMETGEIVMKIPAEASDNIDPDILENFKLTSEFIFYALCQSEWMADFAYKSALFEGVDTDSSKGKKPFLEVIQGGKSEKP